MVQHTLIASALVLILAAAARLPALRRRPALLHMLWMVVFLKFLAPGFIGVPVLRPLPETAVAPAFLPPRAVSRDAAPAEPVAQSAAAPAPVPWTAFLLAASLLGSLGILAHTAIRAFRFHRSLPRPSRSDPRLAGSPLPVRVLDSPCAPFLWPFGRASICLPRSLLEGASASELASILAHEHAHHRRRDALTHLLALGVAALHWWNPLVWFARRQLRHAQELCCDAMVLAARPESRREYAELLYTTLSRFGQSPVLAPSWGAVSSLKARFRMIGDPAVAPRLSVVGFVLAALFLASLLCVPTRAVPAQPAQPAGPVRNWKAQIVDGLTGKPLAGVSVRAGTGVYTTDAQGMIQVPVADGTASFLSLAPSEKYWSATSAYVGTVDGSAKEDPDTPRVLKAFEGARVTGRLVTPEGKPVPQAPLTVGVYISSQEWKKRLGMDLNWYSWDHGDWPNWSTQVLTDEAGRFEATVPPGDARSWVRVGTTELGFGRIPASRSAIVNQYAPFEAQEPSGPGAGDADFGELRLESGVILRGKVLDAEGKPLAGISLYTSGPHGPYAGRSAVSGPDGSYAFLPMRPGSFTLSPQANLKGSRDVAAVFVSQAVTLPRDKERVELTIQAVPHVTLEFDWIDRRSTKGPVSYYNEFPVTGQFRLADGSTVHWRGETELTTRQGKPTLFVKVPRDLQKAVLSLPADSVVTASYQDDRQKAGPGTIELGDVARPAHRIIFGDEPRPAEPAR